MVVFSSRFTRTETDAAGEEVDREIPFLKAYLVFNVAQVDGLPEHFYGKPAEPVRDPIARIEHADRFFANTGAVIRHGGDRAYFAPLTDHIQMPPFQTFRDAAVYVATLLVERPREADFGAASRETVTWGRYGKDCSERAREELIAWSSGSCFLCADLGIVPVEPWPIMRAYLDSWLKVLADDALATFHRRARAAGRSSTVQEVDGS